MLAGGRAGLHRGAGLCRDGFPLVFLVNGNGRQDHVTGDPAARCGTHRTCGCRGTASSVCPAMQQRIGRNPLSGSFCLHRPTAGISQVRRCPGLNDTSEMGLRSVESPLPTSQEGRGPGSCLLQPQGVPEIEQCKRRVASFRGASLSGKPAQCGTGCSLHRTDRPAGIPNCDPFSNVFAATSAS